MATIFLSHSSVNDALASKVVQWLKRNGFDDLFVDHDSIRSGDKWTEALRRAKGACRVVLCLVTPEWLASDECYGEFVAGWYGGRRIIPLLGLGGAELDSKQQARLNRVLAEDQGFDLSKVGAPEALSLDLDPQLTQPLVAGLRAAGAQPKLGLDPFAFEIDRNENPEPYPGLESFNDLDASAALFFGRSPEIAQCMEDLREMRATGDHRIYAILGASGSGKSSLMKAGVLPRLRRERGWFVLRSVRPGADPLLNFADAVARTSSEQGTSRASGAVRDSLLAAYRSKADLRNTLDEIFQPLKTQADRAMATVLIALDQAEELARAEGESADCLAALLRAALAPAEGEATPYAVAFTVRSDSFAELQAASRLMGLGMRSADIRALPAYRYDNAIEQPAARYGVEIEPHLVEALMEDAGGKDALPLLAFTLQRLWRQYAAEGRIRRDNYNSVGKLSGLIEDAAERALRGIDPSAQQGPLPSKVSDSHDDAAAHVFVPALAQVNEQGSAIRRVAKLAAFDDFAHRLLDGFDRWRLVVKSGDNVEVSHESMFREWPRFRRWLELERQRLLTLRGLESAAMNWVAKERRVDELVHSGRRLREVRHLAKLPHFKALIDRSADCREYLRECTRNVSASSLIFRFVAVVLPVQVFAYLCWITFGYFYDGAKSLPFTMSTSIIALLMWGGLAVALFSTAIGLRAVAKKVRVSSDVVTLLLAAVAASGFLYLGLVAPLTYADGIDFETFGKSYKQVLLQQYKSMEGSDIWLDMLNATGISTIGALLIVSQATMLPVIFSGAWAAAQILSLACLPIVVLLRMGTERIELLIADWRRREMIGPPSPVTSNSAALPPKPGAVR